MIFITTLKDEIKILAIKKGWTMSALSRALNEKNGAYPAVQYLTNKIYKETITYKEILEIADILGYKIVWQEKDL